MQTCFWPKGNQYGISYQCCQNPHLNFFYRDKNSVISHVHLFWPVLLIGIQKYPSLKNDVICEQSINGQNVGQDMLDPLQRDIMKEPFPPPSSPILAHAHTCMHSFRSDLLSGFFSSVGWSARQANCKAKARWSPFRGKQRTCSGCEQMTIDLSSYTR